MARSTAFQPGIRIPVLLLASLLASCAGNPPAPAGDCPQPRATVTAPDEFLHLRNPLPDTDESRRLAARLYQGQGGQVSCTACHGVQGDGQGLLASRFNPRPRNFTCAATMAGIPDGQLFWIIRHGSPDAAMPAHPDLDDTRIWQLVHYLRGLAR